MGPVDSGLPVIRRVRRFARLPFTAGALTFQALLARIGPARPRIFAVGTALAMASGCGREPPNTSDRSSPAQSSAAPAPQPQIVLGQPPNVGGPKGYVTSEACVACHEDEHATWHASYHRTMTQPATNGVVLADFDGVVLETDVERFTLTQKPDGFWVSIEDRESSGENGAQAAPPIQVRLSLVTGSHHMQVFWLPAGYGNAQLGFPFTWLIEDKRWAPRHEVFIRDPHAPVVAETWNMTCLRCHVTAGQPRPRPEEQVFVTQVGELGIACEACHGPGADHVAFEHAAAERAASSPEERQAPGAGQLLGGPAADTGSNAGIKNLVASIVHPRKLDHVRSSQVCGQCHSIKWFDESENWVENGFRYRPGDDLEATTPIVRPSQLEHQPWMQRVLERAPYLFDEFFWSDGMIRVAGREFNGLLETPCYQRGEMSCLSCHSMHAYADRDDQLRPGMDTNRACVQCHDATRYGTAHTHHPAGSSGDLCYNCHMPHTTYALLKGVRQHEIDSPDVRVSLETGRLNACNLCHLDRSLEWTAATLQAWYGQPMVDIPDDQTSTAAVVHHLLTGDAGQRALAAWHLGWAPAMEVSGTDWQAPLLARLLKDPYSAVRHIAHRSLTRMPGFTDFAFDFTAPPDALEQAANEATNRWQGAPDIDPTRRTSLLLRPDGQSDSAAVDALVAQRNDRSMRLRE